VSKPVFHGCIGCGWLGGDERGMGHPMNRIRLACMPGSCWTGLGKAPLPASARTFLFGSDPGWLQRHRRAGGALGHCPQNR
jgi:hypothetical protein